MLKDSFSKDGFIINQGTIIDVSFGDYKSCDKGCAWIAVYNYLLLTGRIKITEKDYMPFVVADTVEKYIKLNGKYGCWPLGVIKTLSDFNRPCKLVYSEKKMPDVGIVFYVHTKAAHYVAFQKQEGGKYRFFNRYYGVENDVISLDEFFKDKPIRLIYCPK
jgi:hypothetical protein